MSISRGGRYRVTFDVDGNAYQVEDPNGTVIDHPINRGSSYVLDFDSGRLNGVHIEGADFDETEQVQFDDLGSPITPMGIPWIAGPDASSRDLTQTVCVEPVTGTITLGD